MIEPSGLEAALKGVKQISIGLLRPEPRSGPLELPGVLRHRVAGDVLILELEGPFPALSGDVAIQVVWCHREAAFALETRPVGLDHGQPPTLLLRAVGVPRLLRARHLQRTKGPIALRYEPIASDPASASNGQMRSALAADLSASGLRFAAGTEHAVGEMLRLVIDLSPTEGGELELAGRIVRCRSRGKEQLPVYEVAVSFVELTEERRSRILRFIALRSLGSGQKS